MKQKYPLFWHYIAATIDENCAPGKEYLNGLSVPEGEEETIAAAERELEALVAAGRMDTRLVWIAGYMNHDLGPATSKAANLWF